MLNDAIFIGRLTSDGDLRYTPWGEAELKVTIAVDRAYKTKDNKKITDFHTLKIRGKFGETLAKQQLKGRLVAVKGPIYADTFKTSEGRNAKDIYMDVQVFRFLDYPKNNGQEEANLETLDPNAIAAMFGGTNM
jgi:single-strand DNA-binding protein